MSGRKRAMVAWGALVVVAAAAGAASAQVAQVRDRQPLQQIGGRALDANLSLDSPYNAPVTRGGVDPNLIVTGNVTLGLSFRGFSPVRDASEFFASTPSGTLSAFRRDSVGIAEIARNPSGYFSPTPYFAQELTTANPVGLPTSVAPVRPASVPGPIRISGLETIGVPGAGGVQQFNPLVEPLDLPEESSLNLIRGTEESLTPPAAVTINPFLVQSPLFSGNPALTEEFETNPALNPLAGPQGMQARTSQRALEQERELARIREMLRPSEELPQVVAGQDFETGAGWLGSGGGLSLGTTPAGQEGTGGAEPGMTTATPGGVALPGWQPPSGDLYSNMLNAVQFMDAYRQWQAERAAQARREALTQEVFGGQRGIAAESGVGSPIERERPEETAGGLATAAPDDSRQRAIELLSRPIDSFAGLADTPLNRALRQAEQYLRQGEYYRAAEQYSMAHLLAPKNPLPMLGEAMARFAAGEYYSAAYILQRAVARFVDLAHFRLDIRKFLTDTQMLDIRRADLIERTGKTRDAQLQFLLGFMEYYGGHEEFGWRSLESAAELAGDDSEIAQFVQRLRARRALEPRWEESAPGGPSPADKPPAGEGSDR